VTFRRELTMSIVTQDFRVFPEEVYRVGNSTSPRMSALRVGEVLTYELRGVRMVVANGKGISVFTLKGLKEEGLTGFAWKFDRNTPVEPGPVLIDNEKPEYCVLAPARNRPLGEYKGLLEKMGPKCAKNLRIKKDGTMEVVAQ
jgi:hypothetical protein